MASAIPLENAHQQQQEQLIHNNVNVEDGQNEDDEDEATIDIMPPRNSISMMFYKAQLWLDGSVNLPRVMARLQQDDSIQFLDIYMRDSFLLEFTRDALLEQFMTTLGSLPRLERLDISCPVRDLSSHQEAYFPIKALKAALQSPLTHLLLVNLKLSGSSEEFDDFATRIGQLSNLHFVVLAEVRLAPPAPPSAADDDDDGATTTTYSLLDSFLRALSDLKHLGHVLVTGGGPLGKLRPDTLPRLMSSKSLRDLCLSQLQISDRHVSDMAPLMGRNETLREVDLECCLQVDGARALAEMLQANTTLLELTIRLPMKVQQQEQEEDLLDEVTIAGEDLELSSDSERTTNPRNPDLTISSKSASRQQEQQIQQAQHRNAILASGVARSRLRNFELHNVELSSEDAQAPFRQMLRDNFSLRSCRLTCGSTYMLKGAIDFFMKLNRLGRGSFLSGHPKKDRQWMDMLEMVNDDISGLFYFLFMNPSLCGTSSETNRQTTTSKQSASRKRKRL